jgi:hypothetical protein
MKVRILIMCAFFSVMWAIQGCGLDLFDCPTICLFNKSSKCRTYFVTYHSASDRTSRKARVDFKGCIVPQPDNTDDGFCPTVPGGDNEIIVDNTEFIDNPSCPFTAFSFPLNWYCQDPALGHLIGRIDHGGWSATVGWDPAGWLQYGPYTTTAPVGDNVAIWSLMIDNNSADNNAVLILDVNDATTQTSVASTQVTRQQWVSTNTYQPFALPFTVDQSRAGHMFEFRVYWLGQAYVKEQGCGFKHMDWNGIDWSLGHQVGRQDWDYWSGWTAWSAGPGWGDTAGWLQYGPYTNTVPVGDNLAIWNLLIDDNTSDDNPVLYLDVSDATTQTILAMTQITRTDWLYANNYQTFALPFTVDSSRAGHTFEFRAYWYGSAYVNEQAVGFTPAE